MKQLKISCNLENIEFMMTRKEKRIVDLIRKTEHGEIKIFIQNYEPVRIEEIMKSIKL